MPALPHVLGGISETFLAPPYLKAVEFQRPDAIIKDEMVEALAQADNPRFFNSEPDQNNP